MPNKNKPNNENNMYQLFFKGMYLFLQYDVFIFSEGYTQSSSMQNGICKDLKKLAKWVSYKNESSCPK